MPPVGHSDKGCDHCGARFLQEHGPSCPANPALNAVEPWPDPSPASQSRFSGQSRPSSQEPDKLDLLLDSLKAQTKALEEYTKATANLTIHIGLLIQAMADGEDDSGDIASVRTLG